MSEAQAGSKLRRDWIDVFFWVSPVTVLSLDVITTCGQTLIKLSMDVT